MAGPLKSEIHGSYKVITDSPVLRLAQAIASLTTPDGNTILVPRYYDAIRPPIGRRAAAHERHAAAMESRRTAPRARAWASRVDRRHEPRDALIEYLFNTTLNVDGMWSGYTGPGMKTILPHIGHREDGFAAGAGPDPGFGAGADPRAPRREGLHGHHAAQVERVSAGAVVGERAARCAAAIGTYHKYGFPPSVAPRLAGSAPYYVFTKRLGLPMIAGGIGHGSGAHGPDEYMVIEPNRGSAWRGWRRSRSSTWTCCTAWPQTR